DCEANLAWDLSNGPHRGRVYLVYLDEVDASGVPTNETNNTDVFVRFSDNDGQNWSAPIRVNDNPDTDMTSQFMPAIAVDQTTGNVAVTWLDCRNDTANNTHVQVFGSVSGDGGATWETNVQISQGTNNGLVDLFNFGDYDKMTFDAGVFYRSW